MSKPSAEPLPFLGWVSDLARGHAQALTRIARHEGLSAEDALDAIQEVARELSLTPSHVAVLLHRAKAELQRCVMS
ncbi:hypothetical protein F0U60_34085 [Archangium minus]|uniref:ANTAR domain-containing protein n=1 Tax=Archangium minus TaxID=83450 RepID=A0ABY9WZK3_9BACT|nr:hypothetical protein F0U60_34085 [Archangium minus]